MDFDEIMDASGTFFFVGLYTIAMIIASPIILIGFIITYILYKFGVTF